MSFVRSCSPPNFYLGVVGTNLFFLLGGSDAFEGGENAVQCEPQCGESTQVRVFSLTHVNLAIATK